MTDEKNVDNVEEVDAAQEQKAGSAEEVSSVAEAPPEGAPANEENVDDAGGESSESEPQKSAEDFKVVNENDVPEEDAEAAMLAMLEELPEDESSASPEDINFDETPVAKAEFQQLSQPAGKAEPKNIDILMDINLPISIELGRTKMSIADILGLGPGSVVELNKLAGEPVDVLVNHKIVAKGEVVVIDENFGVRITQLMTPEERLKLLGEEE